MQMLSFSVCLDGSLAGEELLLLGERLVRVPGRRSREGAFTSPEIQGQEHTVVRDIDGLELGKGALALGPLALNAEALGRGGEGRGGELIVPQRLEKNTELGIDSPSPPDRLLRSSGPST